MGDRPRGNRFLSPAARPAFRIAEDPATGPEITALIRFHLVEMNGNSPPESVHALGLDALRAPDVTLWSLWEGSDLFGCGALKQLDPTHGEIKSMRTDPSHLRKGVASTLLAHIIAQSRLRGYTRLSLETGSGAPFAASQALYRRFGFVECGAFGNYTDTEFNRFMTLVIVG